MLNSNATSRPGPRALAEYAIPGRRVIAAGRVDQQVAQASARRCPRRGDRRRPSSRREISPLVKLVVRSADAGHQARASIRVKSSNPSGCPAGCRSAAPGGTPVSASFARASRPAAVLGQRQAELRRQPGDHHLIEEGRERRLRRAVDIGERDLIGVGLQRRADDAVAQAPATGRATPADSARRKSPAGAWA